MHLRFGILLTSCTDTLWSTRIVTNVNDKCANSQTKPENFQETFKISSRFPGVLDTVIIMTSMKSVTTNDDNVSVLHLTINHPYNCITTNNTATRQRSRQTWQRTEHEPWEFYPNCRSSDSCSSFLWSSEQSSQEHHATHQTMYTVIVTAETITLMVTAAPVMGS